DVGVTEFVALVPERGTDAANRSEVKNRQVICASGKQWHECRTMMMADRIHFRPGLIDFTMDHALGILSDAGVAQRLRVEVVFNEIVWRHKFGRARARQ